MSYYKKKLEGITTNNALLELWKDAYSKKVLQQAKKNNKSNDSDSNSDKKNDNSECTSKIVIGGPTNEEEAIEVLRKGGDPIKQKKIISIRVIQAIRIIFENDKKKMELLDNALQQQPQQKASSTKNQQQRQQLSLVFTSPPSKISLESSPEGLLTPERRNYLIRIEKLKLQSEETKYSKITTNIKDQRQEDDITTKSMTYAASVGINMIVAPISFGTFMFFFSGGVFDFFFPPNTDGDDFNTKNLNPTGVDIKRVIIGVISGVIMMIIEMLLFVIRTHEFDHYTTKKKNKRGIEPFGVYSSKSNKIYTTDNPDISKNNITSSNNNKTKNNTSSTVSSKDKKNS
ncbi:hypothetical protein FRACYDRAFT_267935 [Fragilariopsis cylindrus CCMP1102]|uniref:Uncharacterized protein n=1 Tax=Fragilariopsis cylindrus CCMP1102 TaxID=635003 RepID=A0A1E7FTJ0_9STRA|nr:hypothetical protein FRACYDRAFT_267935 [Fragilariopsis cylindrus CCMP1102]|eukprot:OEU21491.1 hypothetical protein FRACYDRAFT_267935 [Fragilariopsis cylindrus CCMP1102]